MFIAITREGNGHRLLVGNLEDFIIMSASSINSQIVISINKLYRLFYALHFLVYPLIISRKRRNTYLLNRRIKEFLGHRLSVAYR